MKTLLDWAEEAGLENIRFRLKNAETLAKDASVTLTLLLAGMGGALAYAVKELDGCTGLNVLSVGSLGLSIWLMGLSILLICQCILSTELPVPTNEPKNLYQKKFDVDLLREIELKGLQESIEQVTARNHRIAAWLDRVRLMAAGSPLIFILFAGVGGVF